MVLYLIQEKKNIDATADYDVENKVFVVKKGSRVSKTVNHNTTFRSADSIEKMRANGVVVNGKVMKDVEFKSASTAANFITGTSTNGLISWKNEKGICLKAILEGEDK